MCRIAGQLFPEVTVAWFVGQSLVVIVLAFILGVVPLLIAVGAGAEMRQSLGTAVFSGMLGVTLFGLVFTPVFYVVTRSFAGKKSAATAAPEQAHPAE